MCWKRVLEQATELVSGIATALNAGWCANQSHRPFSIRAELRKMP
jgi:hypothetical protein